MGFVAKDETLTYSKPKDETPFQHFVARFRHPGQNMAIRVSAFSMP